LAPGGICGEKSIPHPIGVPDGTSAILIGHSRHSDMRMADVRMPFEGRPDGP
jgi:hypothetical protein